MPAPSLDSRCWTAIVSLASLLGAACSGAGTSVSMIGEPAPGGGSPSGTGGAGATANAAQSAGNGAQAPNGAQSPEYVAPGVAIDPRSCNLGKLDAVRCAVPSMQPCGGDQFVRLVTDFREQPMPWYTTEERCDEGTVCSRAVLIPTLSEDQFDGGHTSLALDTRVQLYTTSLLGGPRLLGYTLPDVEPPTDGCFQLPPYAELTPDDLGMTLRYADECGNLMWIGLRDWQGVAVVAPPGGEVSGETPSYDLVVLQVRDGEWQPPVTYGPTKTFYSVSTSGNDPRQFVAERTQPLGQRILLHWRGDDGVTSLASYSVDTGWSQAVQLAALDTNVRFSFVPEGQREVPGARAGAWVDITATGVPYAIWAVAGEDGVTRFHSSVVAQDATVSRDVLWEQSPGTTIGPVRILRMRDGRELVHWSEDDAGDVRYWTTGYREGRFGAVLIGESIHFEGGWLNDRGEPRRYFAAQEGVEARDTDSVIELMRFDSDGVAASVGTLSDGDGDATDPKNMYLADGRTLSVWTQFDGKAWTEDTSHCPEDPLPMECQPITTFGDASIEAAWIGTDGQVVRQAVCELPEN